MIKASWTILIALFSILVLCPIGNPAEGSFDYVVTVGNETLTFVARPERGYVVKAAPNRGKVGVLAATLFMADGDVTPIRGLDRHGIWVVENEYPAAENENTIGMLTAHSQVQYAAPLFSSNGETTVVLPEIVVRVKPGTETEQVRELCESINITIIKRMEFTEQEYLLEVLGPDADAVFTAVERLNAVDWIEWAAPNTAFKPRLCGRVMPNDPDFDLQWHLHNTGQQNGTPGADINAPDAWEITTGDPNIIVAVLDTGVDANHPDLVNNLVPGYDFYDNDDSPDPVRSNWAACHGTACAGLVAAQGNNGIGVSGVAWNCKIMPIRTSSTSTWVTADVAAKAFRWAANNGADVITCSWEGSPGPISDSAIVDVTKPGGIGRNGKGCVVLAAAGNDNVRPMYPASHPDVIAVGATDNNDQRWWYSNYGPELDIVAPGGAWSHSWVWTTDITGSAGYNQGDYMPGAGTSSACPVAAGVAALILSIEPDLTQEEVRYSLERSAKDLGDPGKDDYNGWGRVDARAAVELAMAARADLNDDNYVDFRDFSELAQYWMQDESSVDIYPPPGGDGVIDVWDVVTMGEYWLREIPGVALVAHWKLDETEGTVAYDSAGDNDATVHSGEWAEGIIDGALQFGGFNTYMDCGQSEVLGPEQMTLTMWLRPEHVGGMRYIVSRGTNSPDDMDYVLMRHLNGELEFAVGQLGSDPVSALSTGQTPLDEWSHVAVSMDGSRASVYTNGELDAFADYDERVAREGYRLVISSYQASTRFYNGKIDDVRIYDAALSPEEIKAIER
ncbi:MAG: S8 family serine peptidase [Planctomycetota bacterium]|jgi:subtilisin family serine protease